MIKTEYNLDTTAK